MTTNYEADVAAWVLRNRDRWENCYGARMKNKSTKSVESISNVAFDSEYDDSGCSTCGGYEYRYISFSVVFDGEKKPQYLCFTPKSENMSDILKDILEGT